MDKLKPAESQRFQKNKTLNYLIGGIIASAAVIGLVIWLSGSSEPNTKEKDAFALKDAEITLQKLEQEQADIQLKINNLSNDIAEKQIQVKQNEDNKGKLQENLVNLKSALDVAKERAEDAKEWKVLRSQAKREVEIAETAESVYNLERTISETEQDITELKVKGQELDAQLFELNSRQQKNETELENNKKAVKAVEQRIKDLGGILKF
jgi:peptidoglycan hydrolase CwlO-like protein